MGETGVWLISSPRCALERRICGVWGFGPVDSIYEETDRVWINGDECIDCALCVPACPVGAIVYREGVSE
jgi:Fe-S-cluster-containing hydrogenase component 2